MMAASQDEACSRLYFDPNKHPKNTLKAFQEFLQCFQLRYDAVYPDPPKVSLEAAVERWKISNTTTENPSPRPNLEEFNEICEDKKSRDKIAKFLGMYSSSSFILIGVWQYLRKKQEKMQSGQSLHQL